MATNNNNKALNVPHLRFPEFSGVWKKVRLGEKCNMLCGYAFNGEDIVEQGSYLLMRGINITEGSIRHSSELDRYYSGSIEKLDKYKLAVGDLVIGMDGSKVGRNSAIVSSYEDGSYLVQRVCRIKSSIGNNYILQFINNTKFHQYVDTVKTSSAIPHISLGDIQNFRISIPPTQDETDKIAKLFLLLDERIATQNKIIEDLKKLKSAISKQVFAQEPNGWSRLDTLFSKGKAGGTPTSTNKEYYNGEIPFLSINDITKQGKYVQYTENHLSQSGLENSSAWVVPKYSLIMSMYASVGLVTINEIPITTSQAMFAMQLKDKDLLDYLYYYLSYFKYRHIHKYLETGTQSNINADIVRGIMIPTYGHSRNMEIASTLQSIDVKIDNELSVLKLFNRQKNYLLSQMFI